MKEFSPPNLFPPKELSKIKGSIKELQSQHASEFSLQHTMIHKDGHYCWVQHKGTITYDKKWNPINLVSSIIDITENKVSELELKESEERYRALFESSNEGLILLDKDYNTILYANETIAQLVDYSTSDLIKMRLDEITNEGINKKLRTILQIKNSILSNIPLRRSNHEYIYVDINCIQTTIDENEYFICLIRDVTERKKYEYSILESKKKYHAYLANAPYGVFIVDSEGNYKEVNRSACILTGYTESELLKMNIQDIINPNFVDETLKDFNTLLSTGKMESVTNCIAKDGRNFHLSINAVKINENTFIGFGQDITRKLETEKLLTDSEEQFKKITEQSFDVVIMRDLKGIVTYTSPAIRRTFGYDIDELLGKSVKNYFPKDELEKIKKIFNKVNQGHLINNLLTKFIKKDGKIVEIEVNAAPIYKDKIIVGACGFLKDVTERNAAERKLKDAEANYRNLFESAPVSIWREDFSDIKVYIESLKENGIKDFKKYFNKHPEEIMKCLSLLKVVDFNDETVSLLKAKDKDEIFSSLDKVFTINAIKTFKHELLYLIEGHQKFSSETTIKTFDNKTISVMINISMDNSVDDWSNAYVSIIDITDLKNIENALRESEKRYHTLFENSIAAIYLFDAQKNFIDSNQAGLDLLGYSHEELLQLSISDVDAEAEEVEDAHQNLDDGDNLVNLEHRLIRKDGKIITVLNNSKPIFDSSGNVIALQSTLLDITKRKQSEKALKESEKKYRDLFEVAQEGIWVLDASSHTTLVNKSIANMLGYTIEEMIGKHLFDFMNAQGIEIAKTYIKRREEGIKEQHDFEFITKQGNKISTMIETAPIFDDENNYIGAIAGVIDITSKKAIETALIESKKLTDQILDRSNAVVYIKDLNHQYLYVNSVFTKKFKLNTENLKGKTDYDIFTKAQADIFFKNDTKAIVEKKHIRIHETSLQNDKIHTYISDKFPLFDSKGEIYATCGISTDITDLIEAQQKEKYVQQQLVRKDRLINVGHMAAAIAHEINNPMTVLHGSLEEIEATKGSINNEIIENMLHVSRRIKNIISNLLIFTRQSDHQVKPTDINSIIKNTFLLINNLLHKSAIEYKLELSEDELVIAVDQVQIQQVFLNIIFNAMHAMEQGGLLKIKSYTQDNNICISFDDNGTGIAEEDLKSIFLPFFTTKEVGEGTGLGLSISHGIIEDHEGSISVTSQAGIGTVFTITLPK